MSTPNYTFIGQNDCSHSMNNNSYENGQFKTKKPSHDNVDTIKTAVKNGELKRPILIAETDSRAKLLTNSSILNQRYQNVLRFPNYRQRKKGAFEKKLRRCGVELDGEKTILNLRKILQPYIYQEINNILDKYIKVYFSKAFKNIRENVNLSSDNWSQTLKCNISKSLYKQYCSVEKLDPFDPASIAKDDFPYFKTPQKINLRDNNVPIDNSIKSEVDNSPEQTSDTNSQWSHFSINEDKIDKDQDLNTEEISSSSEQTFGQDNHLNGIHNSQLHRKRKVQPETQRYTRSPEKSSRLNGTSCSYRKYQKVIYPTQPFTNNSYVSSHYDSNSHSVILQVQKTTEQSSSAMEPGIYLNTHNSIITNINSDRILTHHQHCRKL